MSDPAPCPEKGASPLIPGTYLRLQKRPRLVNGVLPHIQKEYDLYFAQKSLPFRSDEPLVGDPDCSWKSFQKHTLRACPNPVEDMILEEQLGYGVDGVVWKVSIDGTPYALKVFWDVEIPGKRAYYAIQKECWNSALLQMIGASIAQSKEPIYLKPEIECRRDALYNIQAFCNEARKKPRFKSLPGAVPVTSFPRFRKCLGWLKVNSSQILKDRRISPPEARIGRVDRAMTRDTDYYAILYEYISPNEQHVNMEELQAQMDIIYLVGLDIADLRPENWVGGILIDMAALESPSEMHWSHRSLSRINVSNMPDGFFSPRTV